MKRMSRGFGRGAFLLIAGGAVALWMLALPAPAHAQTASAIGPFEGGALAGPPKFLPNFLFSARHTAERAGQHVASPTFPGIFLDLRERLREVRRDIRQRLSELRLRLRDLRMRLRDLPRPPFGR